MASYLTSSTLIDSVKRRAAIPTAQSMFEDEDFLAFANEEMSMGMLPALLQYHEEFLVATTETPLVAGQTSYSIPERAIGNKLRSVFLKDGNGNLTEMVRISPDDLPYYQGGSGFYRMVEYYLKADKLVLVSDPATSDTLVFNYFIRPNNLVLDEQVATISTINRTTGEIALANLPSRFEAAIIGGDTITFDMLQTKGSHKHYAMDVAAVGADATTKVLVFNTTDIPDDLSEGDTIALPGECNIPMLPDDMHVMLAQRVAARCMEALGDTQGLQNANIKLAELETKLAVLVDNRVDSDPQKLTNLKSPLRMATRNFRRRL